MREQSYGIIPIFKKENQILLLLIQQYSGSWAFPKGHSENTESPIQTARREFEEETGIRKYTVSEEKTFFENYMFSRNKRVIRKNVTYFIGFVEDDNVNVQKEEIKDYKWVSSEEALELITFKQTKEILKEAIEYLKSIKYCDEDC